MANSASPSAPKTAQNPAAVAQTGSGHDWLADLGALIVDATSAIGGFAIFSGRTLAWLATRFPRGDTLWPNFYQVGVLSLPVVALTGTFIGMVLAVQSYAQFRALGLETRLGAVINMSLVRELGPVLAATMLAGRVGSAMSAELGTMRVTEQIDALASMGANPIQHLVVPRLLACLFMIPTLVIMADFMGVVGGYFYSVVILGIDQHHYWRNSEQFVGNFDLFSGVFKSLFFWRHDRAGRLLPRVPLRGGRRGCRPSGHRGIRHFVRLDPVTRFASGNHAGSVVRLYLARRSQALLTRDGFPALQYRSAQR